MPDSEPLISATPTQKDTTASYVGAGVAEPSDYPYFSHEKTLKWIRETKEKLPAATPKMREEAFQADPLLKGTIFPYLKNVLLQGFSIQTDDNKLYSGAITEINDYLKNLKLMQAFRDDFLDYAILCGHSYRRMDPDRFGNVVHLEYIEPSSIEVLQDPWDSSIVAYLQHARVKKDWSKYGTREDYDSWFIPFTIQHPEILTTIEDIYLTYEEGRKIGNNPKVFDLFTLYKNKYNISEITNLRIAAAERIIVMHSMPKNKKRYSYYDEDCDSNNNPAPIDSIILAVWLKRLLLTTSPNLIYAALSPFIHLVSGVLKDAKDNMGNPVIISSLPRKPAVGSINYDAELANYNAWTASLDKAGVEVVKALKNGGVYISGPDVALKPIESSRSVSFQLIKGLLDQLNEEICQNFGLPIALISAKGTELASSRNIYQMFNSIQAGKRTEYESTADTLISKQFSGRTWITKTTKKDPDTGETKEVTVTYVFEEIKAHFELKVPDIKDLLNEAQTIKTKAEALTQVKSLGGSKSDLQALGEEYGFGLLDLANYEAHVSPDDNTGGNSGGGAKVINAILKSCLAEVLRDEGVFSASPTDPSGFKEKKINKMLMDAYKEGMETIEEVFEEH